MATLVLNAGSSSLKAALFNAKERLADGRVEEIGGGAPFLKSGDAHEPLSPATTHSDALAALLARFDDAGDIDVVGHRIVHGGALFTAPTRLDDAALARLETLNPLAPLHNPVALRVIRAAIEALPKAAQVGCFDTAFHAGQPEVASRFAIPTDARTDGLRRYGFHGLSYEGLVDALSPTPARLLACHLGNGASLCAIKDGRGVATTMGYSPLDGLMMGTRSGAMDPAAVLELARRIGLDAAERLLNRESGLLGVSGVSSDMRALERSDDPRAQEALALYQYWVTRHAGSMIAALGGIDAIAFTGGVGENASEMRAGVCRALDWTGLRIGETANSSGVRAFHASESSVHAYIVPADEEATIADSAARALRGGV